MINLTREERMVLVFLVGCLLLGSGVSYYRKRFEIALRQAQDGSKGGERSRTTSSSRPLVGTPRNDVIKKMPAKTNINTASLGELIKIKGIGIKTAERIIDYRQQNGPFFFKEDIMKVRGIGKIKFDRIKDKITAE